MEKSKKDSDGLLGVFVLCLLVEHLLRGSFNSSAAPMLQTLLFSAVILAVVMSWFVWAQEQTCRVGWCKKLIQGVLAGVLALAGASSALEAGRFCRYAYGDDASLLYAAVMVMVPMLFLKKKTSLSGAAGLTLAAFAASFAVFLFSVFGRLRVQDLQFSMPGQIAGALEEQLILYPEYLLPAFWYTDKKQRCRNAQVLPVWNLAILSALYVVLEMLFGAGLSQRVNPFHSAAALGAISVFERMEWAMLMLGTAAVSVKLALYTVSLFRVFQQEEMLKKSARGPLGCSAVLLGLGLVLRNVPAQDLTSWLNIGLWGMVITVCVIGTGIFMAKGRPQKGSRHC
ncbi:MAG: hypothetical protein ACI4OL_05065 [Gemmiger sp.]